MSYVEPGLARGALLYVLLIIALTARALLYPVIDEGTVETPICRWSWLAARCTPGCSLRGARCVPRTGSESQTPVVTVSRANEMMKRR